MIKDLLAKGYFPKELPPPFNTKKLAPVLSSRSNLPQSFTNGRRKAKVLTHNLARPGSVRRKLGVPNPVLHYNLCHDIASSWKNTLSLIIKQSPFSLSAPSRQSSSQRAFSPRRPRSQEILERASIRSTAKYILQTDISRFYHSIYTHSIPWAIHSKAKAKNNYSYNLVGNSIDRWIRNGQDRQTLGVPVGPDTSWVVSELILAQVDKAIPRQFRGKGMRWVDDYEFGCSSISEAEGLLANIQNELAEYELDVNDGKSKIIDAPVPLEPEWTSHLRNFKFRRRADSQRYDLIQYFSKAFTYQRENKSDGVLRYAIARLREIRIDASNFDLFSDLLIHCMISEPGCMSFVFEEILKCQTAGYSPPNVKLEDALNDIILRHARVLHASEVAWGLWGAILFNISLDANAERAISKMEDSVIALLALDAQRRGLLSSSLSKSNWSSFMKQSELYENQWLLCYEANVKKWLPSVGGGDHVAGDQNFNYLKNCNVEFYDLNAPKWVRKSPQILRQYPSSGGGGGTS